MRPLLCLGVFLALVGLAACASREERAAATEAEVQALLEAYLPLLGAAYADGDVDRLADLAALKERDSVRRRIEELTAEGRRMVPTFRSLTIEQVRSWNESNAFVSTVEEWDLRIYATGSETLLSEETGTSYRAKYQIKRGDDRRWRILFRTIAE